jgi:hypothetical protein
MPCQLLHKLRSPFCGILILFLLTTPQEIFPSDKFLGRGEGAYEQLLKRQVLVFQQVRLSERASSRSSLALLRKQLPSSMVFLHLSVADGPNMSLPLPHKGGNQS